MGSRTLIVPLPPGLDLAGGCEIQLVAINPTTGAFVSGVGVDEWELEVELRSGTLDEFGPFMLVTGPEA